MYRYIMLAALWIASASVIAQDAATLAAQREAEERERRMTAAITRLEEANLAQQRRVEELFRENANLRRQLVDFENRYKNSQLGAVSQSDIRKVYDKMAEIERNRQADNNLVKEQFVELKKLLDRPPQVIVAPTPTPAPRETKREEVTPLPDAPEFTGDYFPYTIKNGDRLLQVISAYNAELKAANPSTKLITLDMVKKANPKMNPNNLKVGAEIRIPKP